MKTHREDSHLQADQKDLGQLLPSQLSEGTNPVNTFISDLRPPALRQPVPGAEAARCGALATAALANASPRPDSHASALAQALEPALPTSCPSHLLEQPRPQGEALGWECVARRKASPAARGVRLHPEPERQLERVEVEVCLHACTCHVCVFLHHPRVSELFPALTGCLRPFHLCQAPASADYPF